MTKWTQLHSNVHISGGDGFSFVNLNMPFPDWVRDSLTNEEKEFVKLCVPNHKPRTIKGVVVQLKPYDALRMYMCESMSDTFALSHNGSACLIGSRSEQDLFKLVLKFEETKPIKVWDSNREFYIRVAEGDNFSEDGSAQVGNRREHSLNEGW